MTVMFHDIKLNLMGSMNIHRVPGAEFDEVLYADDTICIGTDTREINKYIAEVGRGRESMG